MASDFKPKNTVHTLFKEEIPLKLLPLPVAELFMVGRASAAKLNKINIKTIGELAQTDINLLIKTIEIICWFDKAGKVHPLRFKIENEDRTYKAIKIEKVVDTKLERLCGNNAKHLRLFRLYG